MDDDIKKEADKVSVSLQFVLPRRKAQVLNERIDAWLKERPDNTRGDWLYIITKMYGKKKP